MAMIDYGAIAFKNGNLISTGMFTPMEETCGFSDKDVPLPQTESSFDGNYFVVLGNDRLVLGFYKTSLHWWHDLFSDEKDPNVRYDVGGEFFGMSDYTGWKRWEKTFTLGCGNWTDVTVKPRNGYYVARFSMDDDKYKVYFGYGVDLPFYKRTRRVNYYRSPEYLFKKIRWKFKLNRFFRRRKK